MYMGNISRGKQPFKVAKTVIELANTYNNDSLFATTISRVSFVLTWFKAGTPNFNRRW